MKAYPRAKTGEMHRSSRPKKRSFYGNRHTVADDENISSDVPSSKSAKKLNTASSNDIVYTPQHFYRIIEIVSVSAALSDLLICRQCGEDVQIRESANQCCGFKLLLTYVCGNREIDSGPRIHSGFEINRRMVFAMRL